MFHTTSSFGSLSVALVCALVLGLAFPPQARAIAPRGEEVSVYFTVESGDKLIGGLSEKNFQLFEDGKSVPFRLEQPEHPTRVVLLVEYSESSWMFFDDIDSAMQGFLQEAPPGNWYALVTYSHDVTVQVDFTKQIGRIINAYTSLGQPTWLDTDVYDAVYDTLDKLQRLGGRDVVILIGSGFDSLSAHTMGEVKKQLEATNATVFVLGVGSMLRGLYDAYLDNDTRMELLQAEAFLRMLADKSGGQAWFPRFTSAFPPLMRAVVQILQHQYRLVYSPAVVRDGKFHKIRLKVTGVEGQGKLKVRIRKGWRWLP